MAIGIESVTNVAWPSPEVRDQSIYSFGAACETTLYNSKYISLTLDISYIIDYIYILSFFDTASRCLKNFHGIENTKRKVCPKLYNVNSIYHLSLDSQYKRYIEKTSKQSHPSTSQSPRFFQPHLGPAWDAKQRGLRRHLDLTSGYGGTQPLDSIEGKGICFCHI